MQYGGSRDVVNGAPQVIVDIPRGTSVKDIGALLASAGLMKDDIRFMLLARWQGVATRLRAGEFELPQGKTPLELLDILVTVAPYQHKVTVPEGLRGEEIAAIFAEGEWCDRERFVELMHDATFIAELGLDEVASLEGFLYPDTYYLTRDMSGSKEVISLLVKRFFSVWDELTGTLEERPDLLDTVILASIVEKETGAAAERPLIAAVFHNRLATGMRLQSDPTVIYGSGAFGQPITKSHLAAATPYNTYVIEGLPAGPIANPGREAIAAVLNPAEVDYVYFVSKNDGTHQFSITLRDHINAVNKYQRKNSGKQGKED